MYANPSSVVHFGREAENVLHWMDRLVRDRLTFANLILQFCIYILYIVHIPYTCFRIW